jgi:hypothetical protein
MSRLERRCRMLLLGYPVGYRKSLGEEIIGTLLDATPEGRAWPLPRDVLALVIGGLRARFWLNRQRTTAANVRIAVILAVAGFLCLDTSQWLHGGAGWPQFAGPLWLGPALVAAAVILACTCRRRALIRAAALPAAALVLLAPSGPHDVLGAPQVVLAGLAVLVILAGGQERPGTVWLWPLAALAAGPWLHLGGAPLAAALAVVCIGWIIVDAKLAIAAVTFLFAAWLSWLLARSGPSMPDSPVTLAVVAIVAVVGAPALWRLRKQSAR